VELKALQERVGVTFIYVTHDQEEALTMSDRLAVMNAGRIAQVGTPQEVYESPADAYVADFLGAPNLLTVGVSQRVSDGTSTITVGEISLSTANPLPASSGAVSARTVAQAVIRPERVRVEPHGSAGVNRVPAMVERLVYLGAATQVMLRRLLRRLLRRPVVGRGPQDAELVAVRVFEDVPGPAAFLDWHDGPHGRAEFYDPADLHVQVAGAQVQVEAVLTVLLILSALQQDLHAETVGGHEAPVGGALTARVGVAERGAPEHGGTVKVRAVNHDDQLAAGIGVRLPGHSRHFTRCLRAPSCQAR
jgi:hypothetical protein